MSLRKYRTKNNLAHNIETDEIFIDAEAIRSLEDKGKMECPIKNRTFIALYALVVLGLLILGGRAGYLQVVRGEYYRSLAEGNKLRTYYTAAPRGIIYDRNFESLVYNVPSFDISVNLADFQSNETELQNAILQSIGQITNTEPSDLEKRIQDAAGNLSQMVLVESIDHEPALALEAQVSQWLGIRLEKNARRSYIYPYQFSHLIGYTGRINSEELSQHPEYLFNEYIGKDGLELRYEETLRGQVGQQQIEADAVGKTVKLLAEKKPECGQGLVLNVDANLQIKFYESLKAALDKAGLDKAAAVAVDPRSGAVLSLVSMPSFDSQIFCQNISSNDYNQLCADSRQPLFNRAIAGQYPSGSTIKPMMAAAALQEKIVSPNTSINCTGGIYIANQYNPEVVYRYLDWKTHGITDIIKAIAQSCNVFFYTVGGGHGDIEGLGIDRIKKYLNLFGFGDYTQIDLIGEEKGLIPDREWKEQNKAGEAWYIGDTYHVSIGQGDMLVTPLQMAMSTAAVANEGTVYQPQVVNSIVDENKKVISSFEPIVIRQDFINKDYLKIVKKGMRQAVYEGSAWALADLTVEAAGKTGTAQYGIKEKTHAWFTAFAPYDNPQIALAIIVEGGGEGSQIAASVAKEVLDFYFKQ